MSVSHDMESMKNKPDIELKRAVKFYERRCLFCLTKFCIRLESPGYMRLRRFFRRK